jgi:hypothetical protein
MTSRVISTKLRNLSCLTERAESEKTLATLDIQRENKRQARYQSGDKAKTVNLTKDCIPSRQEEIHSHREISVGGSSSSVRGFQLFSVPS